MPLVHTRPPSNTLANSAAAAAYHTTLPTYHDLPRSGLSADTLGLDASWLASDCETGCGSPPAVRSTPVGSTSERRCALTENQINEQQQAE